jgi:ribosomal protein L11 methyltransferase
VADEDWLAEWKKHWRPTVTARFIIAPTWEQIDKTDRIVIRIEPSMAFGTGTHETTRLCLKAIEENYRPGETFFDVGTGTGILAIAAAKFEVQGSEFEVQGSGLVHESVVTGCDTDEDSIRIALENAELNETPEIEFYVGSIAAETPPRAFVCANLTADVILPLLGLLVEKSKRALVLSGILREQEKLVTDELQKYGVSDCKVETDGEWISILIVRDKE